MVNAEKLLAILAADEAYGLLAQYAGGIWWEGGCHLLGKALKILYPEGELVILMGSVSGYAIEAHHVSLKIGGRYIDGHGSSSEAKLKELASIYWDMTDIFLAEYDEDLCYDFPASEEGAMALASYLQRQGLRDNADLEVKKVRPSQADLYQARATQSAAIN